MTEELLIRQFCCLPLNRYSGKSSPLRPPSSPFPTSQKRSFFTHDSGISKSIIPICCPALFNLEGRKLDRFPNQQQHSSKTMKNITYILCLFLHSPGRTMAYPSLPIVLYIHRLASSSINQELCCITFLIYRNWSPRIHKARIRSPFGVVFLLLRKHFERSLSCKGAFLQRDNSSKPLLPSSFPWIYEFWGSVEELLESLLLSFTCQVLYLGVCSGALFTCIHDLYFSPSLFFRIKILIDR